LVLPPDGKTVQDINNQKNQFLYLITKGFQDGIRRGNDRERREENRGFIRQQRETHYRPDKRWRAERRI